MNRTEARDVIFAHATVACAAAWAAYDVAGVMRYQGITADTPKNGDFWARVSIQTVDEYQETLRNGETRRFVTVGILFVQIMVPKTLKNTAQAKMDLLVEHIRDAFRDRNVADHLEFTAAVIDDNVPPEPAWLVVNVTARFWYRQFI